MSASEKPSLEKVETQSRFEVILNSPIKLLTFCAALLIFSLMSGMMIGSVIKGRDHAPNIATADVEKIFHPKNIKKNRLHSKTNEDQNINNIPTKRPIDALEHDPTDYRNAPENITKPEEPLSKKEIEIASLPPEAIQKAFPEVKDAIWRKYAIPTTIKSGAPLIAIVIDDVGLNSKRVQMLLDLPTPLTLSFLPYADNLQKYSKMSHQRGHEVMLHLPMEPTSKTTDPGPNALLQALDLAEIKRRTVDSLDRFQGYVGVNNHMGSKFTAYKEGMTVVMDEIASRGLLFLDSRTTSKSFGYQLARARNIPTGNRDVFIDNDIDVAAILKQLKKVETLAKKNGISIAIGHPYTETIEALSSWMPEAQKRGFQFVPVTAALVQQSAKAN